MIMQDGPDLDLAANLFEQLSRATRQGRGIVRDSYGAGEQAAHDIVRAAAQTANLEVRVDAIGNLFVTLPGRDRHAPRALTGSHLDSVPQGGNFDGAAGVVAGVAVLAGLKRSGYVGNYDLSVMGIRAEETAWFDAPYLGSGGALGLLDPACLDVQRSDNRKSLESALLERGFDPRVIRERRRLLDPSSIRAFVELHIEQGPTLVAKGLPAAAVTGVRGCRRFRNARCIGEYGHSGGVNRPYRRDAVAATVALLARLERFWLKKEQEGADLTITTGELYTDPRYHGPSKIAGETRFVIDIRSVSESTMSETVEEARRAAQLIGEEYRVELDLGPTTDSLAAMMDPRLRAAFAQALPEPFEMPSGAGHDAVMFASAGIPTGMVFVRNESGSHNPDEAMSLEDFAVATRALQHVLTHCPLG
jgi:beta-ureidopropionase / N-carbamoyl-L-amino-acid hydrolase